MHSSAATPLSWNLIEDVDDVIYCDMQQEALRENRDWHVQKHYDYVKYGHIETWSADAKHATH